MIQRGGLELKKIQYDSTCTEKNPIQQQQPREKNKRERPRKELNKSTMSQDLVWQLVRNNSAFIHKRRCGSNKVIFNSEPNNLTNLNRFKDSGLANAQAVSLVADAEQGVTMSLKSAKRQRQIKKNAQGTLMKGSFRKVAKAITKKTRDSFYRSDLSDAALSRW